MQLYSHNESYLVQFKVTQFNLHLVTGMHLKELQLHILSGVAKCANTNWLINLQVITLKINQWSNLFKACWVEVFANLLGFKDAFFSEWATFTLLCSSKAYRCFTLPNKPRQLDPIYPPNQQLECAFSLLTKSYWKYFLDCEWNPITKK